MQCKLYFLLYVAKTGGEIVTSSKDYRSGEIIAESSKDTRAGRACETRGEELGLKKRPQTHWRGKREYSCSSSGQGGIQIRHWEVLSNEKVMGAPVLGLVG